MNKVYIIEVDGWDIHGEDFDYIVDTVFTSKEDAQEWLDNNKHIHEEVVLFAGDEPRKAGMCHTYVQEYPVYVSTKD